MVVLKAVEKLWGRKDKPCSGSVAVVAYSIGQPSASCRLRRRLNVGVLNIFLLVLMFLSGVLTVILVLMHSGKGTGVSDMIAASMYNANSGSGVWEKNLDRLTVITTTVFMVSIIIMALTFPLGTI
jgi:preprotein translocase subunit SecG